MSKYFSYFPKVKYGSVQIRDITRRSVFLNELNDNIYAYLPYTVENDELPEHVAHHYYGSVDYTWIVLMSNKIIDPYTEWPMPNDTFIRYLEKKYKTRAEADGFSKRVLEWTLAETIDTNIEYYINLDDEETKISKESTETDSYLAGEWRPVRVFEMENELNENKRQIRLLNLTYRDTAVRNFESIING